MFSLKFRSICKVDNDKQKKRPNGSATSTSTDISMRSLPDRNTSSSSSETDQNHNTEITEYLLLEENTEPIDLINLNGSISPDPNSSATPTMCLQPQPSSGKPAQHLSSSVSSCSPKVVRTGQTVKLEKYIDKITDSEILNVNEKLSNFFFGCNIPLQVVDSDHFKNFVRSLRPSYKIPGRKALSTTLLDCAYEKSVESASQSICGGDSVLLIDGWKNTSNNSKMVVTMVHNAKGGHAFVGAWDLTQESETGDKLAEIVEESIEIAKQMYNTTIYAVVSDNAAAMLKMGRTVQIWHSNCSSHTANLLALDILDEDLTRKVKSIITEFKHPDFERALVKKGGTRMQKPIDTRWCTYRDSYACVIKNIHMMRLLIVSDNSFRKIKPDVKQRIFDDEFVQEVADNIAFFDPVCRLINIAQKENASLAEVAHLWIKLSCPETFSKFSEIFEQRKKKALNIYALCAYYLHPKYHDESIKELSVEQLRKVQDFLLSNLEENGVDGLCAFQEKSEIFGTLAAKQIKDPITFWSMVTIHFKSLASLALRLQKIPASSAQIERLFSNWSYVHSRLRNKLTFERSKKLLNVYYTLKHIDTNKSDEY